MIDRISLVLSNKARIEMLNWLKTPEDHFAPHVLVNGFSMGVCVGRIQEKSNLSPSTVSHYLTMMQNAGLIIATRIGKNTYYKRDENAINRYITTLQESL